MRIKEREWIMVKNKDEANLVGWTKKESDANS